MARPVLENMANGTLRENMLTEYSPSFDGRDRKVAYMEAFGRLMAGLAPWLSLPDDETPEGRQRRKLRKWALAAYKNAVDPQSPDYLAWGDSGQNMVDAAYIVESFVRAYDQLWLPLDEQTKQRYINELKKMRSIEPPYTNWLLFAALIESFIAKVAGKEESDNYRVMMAIRKMEEWYVGDGWYSDGPRFAFDYYNSYVFHSMYLETLQNMAETRVKSRIDFQKYFERALKRAQKYSIVIERLIAPDGTFPVVGRSVAYRLGALQPLALLAWLGQLPSELSNGQVRAALTASLHRMFAQQLQRRGIPDVGLLRTSTRHSRLVHQQRLALHDFACTNAAGTTGRPCILDLAGGTVDTGKGVEWNAFPKGLPLGRRHRDKRQMVSQPLPPFLLPLLAPLY